MKTMRVVFVAVATLIAGPALADNWPSRPITMIVPFAAGGGVDLSARIQAQRMGELLGQPIVVENVGAAAGMAGSARVAKADPDGYTMLIGNSGTHAYSQSLYKTPLYNSLTDFTPVGLASESPRILIARKDLPAQNLQEFIAYVKANQSRMQFGSAGIGSGTHLPCVLLNTAMGVDVTHVPYRGEAPVQQDLIGGRIDYMCSTIQTGAALAKEGTVKGIAVMSAHRVKIIPDLPTTGEQGLPGVEASVWNAFFLPPGTPRPIVDKLNKAMSDTLDDPAVRGRLEDLGLEIAAPERRTPEYLTKFLADEVARWGKVVHDAGISAD
ncbi:MAG TPA: tripartite tricarboxylate transporter substrate-binding protein [Xanthobacteraceae bacterium]|jgi:tripartite-type tricarboxylate transporter receptor subunit TctC|nr:tripartite tricarboxylate transporter substrate-binding protein [Xanthobacteraceae bacterium]